ncbi:hypothetical protein Trydic_g23108 [Trypoxylus dichotomus]
MRKGSLFYDSLRSSRRNAQQKVTLMEEVARFDVFGVIVDLFQLIGEDKHYASLKLLCFRVFNGTVMVAVLMFIVGNFFFVEGELYIRTLQSSFFLTHLLLKYLLFIKHKGNIEDMLKDAVGRFWDYRNFTGNKIVPSIENVYIATKKAQKAMIAIAVFGIISYITKPLYAIGDPLILESVLPRSDALDAVVLISQFYCFCLGVPIVVGYDFTYFMLCIQVILQIRLLKRKLKDTLKNWHGRKGQDNLLEIGYCIRHHQLLLAIFLRMKKVYSTMLLFHYFVSFISTCSILFQLLRR